MVVEKFLDGYNCAQAVFFSFCKDLKIENDIALKLASGFGAGMGWQQEVCGAISGGILVLGAKYGRGENDDRSVMERSYKKTQNLMNRFAEQHGTTKCRQILNNCDLSTKIGQLQFIVNNFRSKKCVPCIKTVIEILEEIF